MDPTLLAGTFAGKAAEEYLISDEEQRKRCSAMEKICSGCHSSRWVEEHFAKMDDTLVETDAMVKAPTELMLSGWKRKLADDGNPFDEYLEKLWVKQRLFYANSVRYASAMTGAPDYAAFKNGWWEMSHNLERMKRIVDSAR